MQLSGTQEVVGLIASVVGAVIGYLLSERDRKRLGRTPWGLASPLWALIWFLIPLLGLVLYLIAHSTGVRRAQRIPPVPGTPIPGPTSGPAPMAPMNQPSVSDLFPSYPRPANSQPLAAEAQRPAPSSGSAPLYPTHPPTPDLSQPVLPTPTVPAGQAPSVSAGGMPSAAPQPGQQPSWSHSPPAWHPDPSGRFHYRWWDGHQWTSHVSIDGQYLIDTSPDQRIGPY